MWPDNETTTDLLGFEVHSRLIEAVLSDPAMLPVTVGVFGDWGGGKTSVLRMLQQSIDPNQAGGSDGKTACIYFNGWLFEGYDDAKAAITSTILTELAAHKTWGPKIRDGVGELISSVNWMRVASFAFNKLAVPAAMAYMTGGASLVPAAIGLTAVSSAAGAASGAQPPDTPQVPFDEWIKNKEPEAVHDVRLFRQRFEALLAKSGIERVIVLVDDLDRCSPKNIVGNLEAIKLFLNVQRTAFVIAADPRIIRFAIGQEYPNIDRESSSESQVMDDYLEKLIQVPYHLPRLSPSETETYMALLFASRALQGDDRLKLLLSKYKSHLERNRYRAFGYGEISAAINPLPAQLDPELKLVAKAAPLVTEGLKGNPRQVKRFLNALLLRKQLAAVAGLSTVRDDVLVKLMILEYVKPRLFRQLYEWQATQDGKPREIATLEADATEASAKSPSKGRRTRPAPSEDLSAWTAPFPTKWLALGPALSDIDLRDYFWIARDRLASTLSDVSLVSPLTRRLLDALVGDSEAERDVAAGELSSLDDVESGQLLDALDEHVRQNPDSDTAYLALMQTIKADLPGAQVRLADSLGAVPASKIPPSVGVKLLNAVEALSSVDSKLTAAIDDLRASESAIGTALRADASMKSGAGS